MTLTGFSDEELALVLTSLHQALMSAKNAYENDPIEPIQIEIQKYQNVIDKIEG